MSRHRRSRGRHAAVAGEAAPYFTAGAIVAVVVLALGGTAYGYFSLGGAGTTTVAAGALAAPANLGLNGVVTKSDVPLRWTAPSTPTTGYRLYRCAGTGCTPTVTAADIVTTGKCGATANSGSATTSCTDTSVAGSTAYTYAVVALDHTWVSPQSNIVSVTTPTPELVDFPTHGTVGETVTLHGSQFTPRVTLAVTFDGQTLSKCGFTTITSGGTWTGTCVVPALPHGTYPVVALQNNQSTASTTFTIEPAITLSPVQGEPGPVTVNGDGFAAASALTFGFTASGATGATTLTPTCSRDDDHDEDGATGMEGGQEPQTAPETNMTGTLPTNPSCTVVIPTTSAEGHGTLTVTDATGDTASATFTVGSNRLAVTGDAGSAVMTASPLDGPVRITRETPTGSPLMTGGALVVSLSSTVGVTFATSEGGNDVTTAAIPAGQSSVTVWFGDAAAGMPTITASALGYTPGTHPETVTGTPG